MHRPVKVPSVSLGLLPPLKYTRIYFAFHFLALAGKTSQAAPAKRNGEPFWATCQKKVSAPSVSFWPCLSVSVSVFV